VPLGANVTVAPVPQKDVPKAERIAYVCSACGYIYDLDTPFEEQPDTYACPVCTAPRESFAPENATLGEGVFDVTKGKDASSN
jgi:rubredoxin